MDVLEKIFKDDWVLFQVIKERINVEISVHDDLVSPIDDVVVITI